MRMQTTITIEGTDPVHQIAVIDKTDTAVVVTLGGHRATIIVRDPAILRALARDFDQAATDLSAVLDAKAAVAVNAVQVPA